MGHKRCNSSDHISMSEICARELRATLLGNQPDWKPTHETAAWVHWYNTRRPHLSLGGITMDESTHTVTVRGKPVELANKEFQLLHFLMVNAGIVFSRDTLYNRIWGMESLGNTATVPVHINRIREAVEEDPSNPKHILTIWGVGYKFQV